MLLETVKLDPMLAEFLSDQRKRSALIEVSPLTPDGACFIRSHKKLSDCIRIDDENDVLVVGDVKLGGDLLRAISVPTDPMVWFRVVRTVDGVAHIETHFQNWNG